jgi:hypothetical protein
MGLVCDLAVSASRAQASNSSSTNDNVYPDKCCGLCLTLASAVSGYRLRNGFSVQPLTAGFRPVNALCCRITAQARLCSYAEKGLSKHIDHFHARYFGTKLVRGRRKERHRHVHTHDTVSVDTFA